MYISLIWHGACTSRRQTPGAVLSNITPSRRGVTALLPAPPHHPILLAQCSTSSLAVRGGSLTSPFATRYATCYPGSGMNVLGRGSGLRRDCCRCAWYLLLLSLASCVAPSCGRKNRAASSLSSCARSSSPVVARLASPRLGPYAGLATPARDRPRAAPWPSRAR
jgi:hypothetical protein